MSDDSMYVAAPVALETFLSRYIASLLEPPTMPEPVVHASKRRAGRRTRCSALSAAPAYAEPPAAALDAAAYRRNRLRPRSRLDSAARAPCSTRRVTSGELLGAAPRRQRRTDLHAGAHAASGAASRACARGRSRSSIPTRRSRGAVPTAHPAPRAKRAAPATWRVAGRSSVVPRRRRSGRAEVLPQAGGAPAMGALVVQSNPTGRRGVRRRRRARTRRRRA